ncbi:MAG: type I addiction module toxin, SymE family [Flavobacteriales bacterium]|nr:MAG: type I addiction module toxin, SymE family [Flavobacteriales bacterium]
MNTTDRPSHGQHPVLLLQGEWLRKAGFEYGDEVIVTVKDKKITVDFEKEYNGE